MIAPAPVLLMVRELGPGGTERQLTEVALALDRSRFEPHVACFHEGIRAEELRARGVPILRLPIRSFLSAGAWTGALQFGRYLRAHRIQLVHTFDYPLNCFGVPLARFFRTPAVLSSQRADRKLNPALYRRLLRVTDHMVDAVVVNCEAVRQQLIRHEGVTAKRIRLCYNGVDTIQFSEQFRRSAGERPVGNQTAGKQDTGKQNVGEPTANQQAAGEQTAGEQTFGKQCADQQTGNKQTAPSQAAALTAATLVIGVVCVLRAEKSLSTLLEAFAQVSPLHAESRLAIVGSGPELAALQERSRTLGIADACRFAPATADVSSWLHSMDIFVLPSLSEALSNSLMEAMACGCAVVASNTGGNPELVADGATGLLFKPGDAGDLASKIKLLMDQQRLRMELGRAAAAVMRENFSVPLMARRMEAIYDEFLGR